MTQQAPGPAGAPYTCRSCGKPIFWLRTRSGSNMPTDAETVTPGDDLFDAKRHTSHFATCPHAATHRRTRASGANKDHA